MAKILWTEEEDLVLRLVYPTTSGEDLYKLFPNRNAPGIKTRATKLKLKKAIGFGAHKKWSKAELNHLREKYPTTNNAILMNFFNCSEKSLYSAAHGLGVKKTAEHISKVCGTVLKIAGKSTQFKKGSVPVNKGKKRTEFMTIEGIENCKKTQFKKGNAPHNTVEIGHERVTKDGYVEVKVGSFKDSTKNFKLKHRLIWEEINGPIPKGYKVAFIDGDCTNYAIENLKLLSKAESLIENSMCDSSIVKRFIGIKEPEFVSRVIKDNPEIITLKRNSIILTKELRNNGINV